MFELNRSVSRNASTDLEDTAKIKMSLISLGYYDHGKTGLSPYADDHLFHSIKSFQKDNDLQADGVITPDGPTQRKIKKNLSQDSTASSAFGDFIKNYQDMRQANTMHADKYFHCKANYEATQKGWLGFAGASFVSNMREAGNLAVDPLRKGLFPVVQDVIEDQRANYYGRQAARSGNYTSARDACAIYRPEGLDEKY